MKQLESQRHGDCKSSIREFDSHSRLHSSFTRRGFGEAKKFARSSPKKWLTHRKFELVISNFLNIDVEILLNNYTNKVALKFEYKKQVFNTLLVGTLSELTEVDVFKIVEKRIQEVDNILTLERLCEFILDCKNGCGANLATRKKSIGHLKDYCKRHGISLSDTSKVFLQTDDQGRTLPEAWQALYNLPHKLRQVRALFSKRNLSLFKRQGWDTSHFGNFVSFVAESSVSQPFSTDDAEVEKIIKFFQDNKEKHPVFYDIYLLAFGAGLRKSEIYQVDAGNFTTFNGQHFLLLPFATKRSKLKGTNHIEKVGISAQLFNHFRGREGKVICGGDRLHKRFTKFLRDELGLDDPKPTHRLRKILGARLATTAGIFHASKTLRNSVAVCEKYYSDLTSHKNELEV